MDDIFDGVEPKKLSNEELTGKIYALRDMGISVRAIGERLGVSKDRVFRVLKEVSQSVAESSQSVAKVSQEGNKDGSPSPAPQGKDYITREEMLIILDEFKANIERVLEEKANKAVNYFIANRLEKACSDQIRAFKEGSTV